MEKITEAVDAKKKKLKLLEDLRKHLKSGKADPQKGPLKAFMAEKL